MHNCIRRYLNTDRGGQEELLLLLLQSFDLGDDDKRKPAMAASAVGPLTSRLLVLLISFDHDIV